MTTAARKKLLHDHCKAVADPDKLNRAFKLGRKIGKTVWAAADHKKAKIGIWASIVGGNIGVAIGTAGVSIPIQVGFGAASGFAGGAITRGVNWGVYKRNKAKLKNVDPTTSKGDSRMDVRRMAENYVYNDVHLKSALARAVMLHGELAKLEGACKLAGAKAPSEDELRAHFLLIHQSYQELDVLLHYLGEFKALVLLSQAFLKNVNERIGTNNSKLDGYINSVLTLDNAAHRKRCGQHSLYYCYGPSEKDSATPRRALNV